MADYKQIMALLVQGNSYRQVQARAGCSHRTISKARQVLDDQKLTTLDQVGALSDEDLDRLFSDGRKNVSSEFVPVNIDAVVKARIGRKKPPLKVMWARYLDTPHTGSARFYGYERFCQIVAEHVKANDLTSPLKHEPGRTMQVDWAGTKMQLTDPITRETTKVSVFVASLPYSGMIFAYGSLDEKLPAWCQMHRRAFEYFQGVTQLVIPDNASTASNQISRYEKARDVNQSYEAFLEYYQSAAVPTGSYKPQEKGHVEAGVKIVTNWIIHYLADRRFTTLDELNEAVAEQMDMINERTPFRGEPRSRREWFEEAERDELIGLPDEPWREVQWRKAKVSRDWHVQVDTIKYSVPHEHAGQTLDVRVVGEQVTILAGGAVIASHQRGARRHSYVTDADHAPHGYEDTSLLWTRAYFIRQATKVGPYTVQALTRLLERKKIEAQGYRSCLNILELGKGNNRSLLEQACHDLCVHDERNPISYTAVKHRNAVLRADHAGRPATLAPGPVPSAATGRTVGVRDTSRAHLDGISQFSLEALTNASLTEPTTGEGRA